VVMSHDFQIDRDVLRVLAAARVSYVGVLGPRRRTEKLLAELVQAGASLSEDFYQRLFAPVGLAVGAETPEEIALAILAEGQAALAGETAGFLRDRVGPLHRREENRQGARPVGHAGAAQVSTRREAAE
jgi:xanthine dehydrogenase accessory factor